MVTRRVLLTGGLGFIGSRIVEKLLLLGDEVLVLDSLLPGSGGSPRNLAGRHPKLSVTIEDTRSKEVTSKLVQGCDIVYHLASTSNVSNSNRGWHADVDIQCLGTLNVLEAVQANAPSCRVIKASTTAVFGRSTKLKLVSEDTHPTPGDVFGIHALAAEQYCYLFRSLSNIQTTVVRFGQVFGPRQRVRGSAPGSVAHLVEARLRGDRVSVPPALQGLVVDPLYIDTVADLLVRLAAPEYSDVGLLNVGRGHGVRLGEIAALIGGSSVKTCVTDDAVSSGIIADISLLKSLKLQPTIRPLEEELAETIDWYMGNSDGA